MRHVNVEAERRMPAAQPFIAGGGTGRRGEKAREAVRRCGKAIGGDAEEVQR
jgi:hypothetical protein